MALKPVRINSWQAKHKKIGLDLYLEHLVALLIKKGLITQDEIDDYINGILVMEKLTEE